MPFKVTYARWLKTHDRSHRGYNMRKSFPWHIISPVDFNPAVLQAETPIYNKQGLLMGHVFLDAYSHRVEDLRHQFDVTLSDMRVGRSYSFRIVFSDDGVLITLHPLGKDRKGQTVKDFLAGHYESYDENPNKRYAHAILKEVVLRLLKSTGQIDKYSIDQHYPGIAITPLFRKAATAANRELRQRMTYTIDLSQQRDVWICLVLFLYEAHAVTFKYAPQCGKFLSLYLVETRTVLHRNVFANAEVMSIYDYFDLSTQWHIRTHLGELAKRVVGFQKFV